LLLAHVVDSLEPIEARSSGGKELDTVQASFSLGVIVAREVCIFPANLAASFPGSAVY
jgi:hypothetical protein